MARTSSSGRAFPLAGLPGARQRGFTLVELLVAIMIIGILAGIVIGVASALTRRAQVEQTRADMAVIMAAIRAFHDETGSYPASLTAVWTDEKAKQRLASMDREVSTGGAFKDRFGNSMGYSKDGGAGGTPVLTSPGPDGKFGNDGERPSAITDNAVWREMKERWQKDNIRSDDR